jgi:hypothetical protein
VVSEEESMKKVFKYQLDWSDRVIVSLPGGSALPLSVGVQDGKLMLWALVSPDAPSYDRVFRICGTGHPIEEEDITFIGTVHHDYGLVFHVFEDIG